MSNVVRDQPVMCYTGLPRKRDITGRRTLIRRLFDDVTPQPPLEP